MPSSIAHVRTSTCSCRYFDPKPKFFFFDDLEGTVCHIVLPSNCPIHRIVSTPQSSSEAAKKDACLKAIEELHKLGVFNDYLLPMQDKSYLEGPMLNSSDSDNHGGLVTTTIYTFFLLFMSIILPNIVDFVLC